MQFLPLRNIPLWIAAYNMYVFESRIRENVKLTTEDIYWVLICTNVLYRLTVLLYVYTVKRYLNMRNKIYNIYFYMVVLF